VPFADVDGPGSGTATASVHGSTGRHRDHAGGHGGGTRGHRPETPRSLRGA